MKNDAFRLVAEHAIVPSLNTEKKQIDFIKAIMNDPDTSYSWEDLAFHLDFVRQQYEFVAFEYTPLSMAYWPSYEEGLATTVAQVSFTSVPVDPDFSTVVDVVEQNFSFANGKGRWCFLGEDEATFYPTFKDLAEAWLADDSIEPDPENTKILLYDQIGLKKAEKAIKRMLLREDFRAFNALEDLLIEVDRSN